MKDLKASLGNGLKPDITHVRGTIMRYIARACEYGNAKYERANFLRDQPTHKDDFERLRGYLRAAMGHIVATLDEMEKHQAHDPNLEDAAGMSKAAFAADIDATPGAPVGASKLPHLAHAAASLMMALEQAADSKLLPADPGRPWEEQRPAPARPTGDPLANPGCVDAGGGFDWDCMDIAAANFGRSPDVWAKHSYCPSCVQYYGRRYYDDE